MKKCLIILLSALISATGAGQTVSIRDHSDGITSSPVFHASGAIVQGEQVKSLNDYLNIMIQYPQKSVNCCIQGTVVVEFVVNSAGIPTQFRILNSVCPEIDREVIYKIESTTGKWIPGTIYGKPAEMKQEVAVVFSLCSGREFIKMAKYNAQRGNRLLFERNKPEKALKYFNNAIILLPYEENLLSARSLCLSAMGDLSGAEKDWGRIRELGKRNHPFPDMEELAGQAGKTTVKAELVSIVY
jgi:tetratricopeptide (TPR) repeat protein